MMIMHVLTGRLAIIGLKKKLIFLLIKVAGFRIILNKKVA